MKMSGERIKHKKAGGIFLFFLLFVLITFNFGSKVYALGLPHPPDTESIEGGALQYRSLLTQSEILQFYRQELVRKGWKIIDTPLKQTPGFTFSNRAFSFIKGDNALTLVFSPFTTEGFVFYTIDAAGQPETDGSAKAEKLSLDNMFKEPESLDFMPIYPGSKQIGYSKNSSGIRAGYMVDGEIDEVKEFYLQGMPRYGWSLTGQESIDGKETRIKAKVTGVTLEFKQEGKSCFITVSKVDRKSVV